MKKPPKISAVRAILNRLRLVDGQDYTARPSDERVVIFTDDGRVVLRARTTTNIGGDNIVGDYLGYVTTFVDRSEKPLTTFRIAHHKWDDHTPCAYIFHLPSARNEQGAEQATISSARAEHLAHIKLTGNTVWWADMYTDHDSGELATMEPISGVVRVASAPSLRVVS